MNLFLQLAIVYPCIVPLIGLIIFMICQNWIGLYFTLTSLLFGEGLNHLLKLIIKLIAPNYPLFQRPNPPEWGCSCFPWVKTDTSFGMPSGHSQISLFTSTFWIMYLLENYPLNWKNGLSILLLIFWGLYVPYTRISTGCHNFIQVLVGSLIGIIFGYLSYIFYKKYNDNI